MTDTQITKGSKLDHQDMSGSKYGYERYMTAKYYKNLTQSQYNNLSDATSIEKGFRRESLNPAVNLARLRHRIATTDAIAARYTLEQKDWLRLSLQKVGNNLWKYKFHYALKFIVAYKVYSEFRNYNYLTKTTVMPTDIRFTHIISLGNWSFLGGLVFTLL